MCDSWKLTYLLELPSSAPFYKVLAPPSTTFLCAWMDLGWALCKLAGPEVYAGAVEVVNLPAVLLLSVVFEASTNVTSDDIASGLAATAEPFFVESRRGMMYACVSSFEVRFLISMKVE